MLNIKEGDIVLVAKALDKPKLTTAKIEFIDGNNVGVIEVENMHIAQMRKAFDTRPENVIAIIDPAHPSYHNKYDAIFQRAIHNEDFGSLNFFYTPTDEVRDHLQEAFAKAAQALEARGLSFIIQPTICVWEIYPYGGEKYAGYYKRNRKADKNPNRLAIIPEHTDYDHSWYSYVIFHELAHHMHAEFVTGRQLNAKWIDLYSTSVPARDIEKPDTDRLLKALLEQEDLPSDFKGQLEEGDQEAYKLILKAIKQQHKLGVKELDVLFVAEFFEQIKAVWPEKVVANDLNPLVTEYATKSYKELFAEAFAYYMSGRELPQEVKELVEESIAYAKAVGGDDE
jgi:hypothetical protein